ncbi:MAG: hypothetical protein WD469_12230 [Paenibacillaceae bacterium]
MGEAKRRKVANDTTKKGSKWKKFKPSSKVKYLVRNEIDQSGIVRWI